MLAAGGLAAALAVVGLLPIGRSLAPGGNPSRGVDERTIMFARKRMVPGSPEFRNYYEMHPEHLEGDERTRSLPGLLSSQAHRAEPVDRRRVLLPLLERHRHRLRALIRRSGGGRRAMLRMDDLFYGRKPPTRPPAPNSAFSTSSRVQTT